MSATLEVVKVLLALLVGVLFVAWFMLFVIYHSVGLSASDTLKDLLTEALKNFH